MFRMRKNILAAALFGLSAFISFPGSLWAQEEASGLKPEIGLWLGASNPMPFTEVDTVLDASIGMGAFYRIRWPWIFLTEAGFSYSHYFSRTTQSLTVVPVYGALVYQLPLPFQLNIFLKAGGGASYLEVRPTNISGWDPMAYAGAEFSLQAGRRVRIGLRLDYNLIYEKHLEAPLETQLLNYFGTTDPRYQTGSQFRIRNGSFFHFGLMVSFFL